jgi:hypothetical protein
MGRLSKAMVMANLCLWVYFWLAFAHASQPYDPRPLGHPPVDPYSFRGHAIGLAKSSLTYPFMKAVFWIEFPSLFFVTLLRNSLLPNISSDRFFAGISVGGYMLLVTMLLSFGQWYFIGWLFEKILGKWFGHKTGARTDVPTN